MTPKKIIVMVGLVAIIILSVYFGIISRLGPSKPPDWVSEQPFELIDTKTGELMTRTLGEWESSGTKDGKYKNPDTGEFTIVFPIVCESCKQKVVGPPGMPVADPNMGGKAYAEAQKKAMELKLEYTCPRCGRPVISGGGFSPGRGGPPGRATE